MNVYNCTLSLSRAFFPIVVSILPVSSSSFSLFSLLHRGVLGIETGVLGAQMAAQRINTAVRRGTVGTIRALRGVRMVVVPSVGHLLAARLTAPHERVLAGRLKHNVIG